MVLQAHLDCTSLLDSYYFLSSIIAFKVQFRDTVPFCQDTEASAANCSFTNIYHAMAC